MEASIKERPAVGPWLHSGLRQRRHVAVQALSKVVNITRNLRQHVQLARQLDALGLLDEGDFYAGIRYRYLRKYYLGAGFSTPERLRVAIHHHQHITEHFRPEFLRLARRHGHGLWGASHDGARLDITLRYPYAYNHDGDLCLSLDMDGKNICIMTFSFAPGALVGSAEARVLLVTGIQGIAGKIAQIRQATQLCNNVAPAHLLLFAACTLAKQIGIQTIVGMGQGRVRGTASAMSEPQVFDYDSFWTAILGEETTSAFYHLALPFADKPIEAIAAKHRSRARKRRELRNLVRDDIDAQATTRLQDSCLIPGRA